MTAPGNAAMRRRVLKVLSHYAGPDADADAIAAAVRRTYDDFVHVLTPVIGHNGVSALTDRALHLVQRQYEWLLHTREPRYAEPDFAQVIAAVKRQEPAVATEGVAALFATFLGLLATLVGEPLTDRLLREAWPDAVGSASIEET